MRRAIRLPLPSARRLLRWRRRSTDEAQALGPALIPADPRVVLAGVLDPELESIRAALRPHRRRLWLRRIVRRAWAAIAAVVLGELALWSIARFLPLEAAPAIGALIPLAGLVTLTIASVRARPSLGETAIAVDREAALGDRAASALALAVAE